MTKINRSGRLVIFENIHSLNKQLEDCPEYIGEGWLKHKNYKRVELEAKIEICRKLLKQME